MTDAPAPPPALQRNRPGEGGRPPDTPVRSFRKLLRDWVTRPLLRLAWAVIPPAYLGYMRFVWWTSRVEDAPMRTMNECRVAHDGAVAALWHEEVFSVAFAYRNLHGHTLASVGDAGEAITRTLERCNFTVFRGGSARFKESRRRVEVLPDLIEHMKTTPSVFYGFTVDGSKGPRYRLKRGAIVVAMECRKPLFLVKTWAKRNIRLPTWDRMAIPLPWNHIRQVWRGPFFVPDEARTSPEAFEAFRRKLERELSELTEEEYRRFGHRIPEGLYDAGEGSAATSSP